MLEFVLFFSNVIKGTRIPAQPLVIFLVHDLIHVVGFVGPLSFVFEWFAFFFLIDRGYATASLCFALLRQLGDLLTSHIILADDEETALILSLMLNV